MLTASRCIQQQLFDNRKLGIFHHNFAVENHLIPEQTAFTKWNYRNLYIHVYIRKLNYDYSMEYKSTAYSTKQVHISREWMLDMENGRKTTNSMRFFLSFEWFRLFLERASFAPNMPLSVLTRVLVFFGFFCDFRIVEYLQVLIVRMGFVWIR